MVVGYHTPLPLFIYALAVAFCEPAEASELKLYYFKNTTRGQKGRIACAYDVGYESEHIHTTYIFVCLPSVHIDEGITYTVEVGRLWGTEKRICEERNANKKTTRN